MHVIICISEFACMRPRISMLAYQLRLLHCPRCPVAESGTKIPPAFTTRKNARQKGKSCVCITQTHGNVHTWVYQAHGSCMFLCTNMCKQSSADCCRRSKVFTTRMRSPFPCHTYKQNAACATCIYANIDWRRNGNTDACLTR